MCEHRERAARTRRLIKSGIFYFFLHEPPGCPTAAGKLWNFRQVPTAAWFPCFTAGRGSDDRLGQNEACDFPCSGEAVISRLSVSFVKLPWALSSHAALQVDRMCFIKRHQKVRPSEISHRRAERSPAFWFHITPLLQRSAVSVSLIQAQTKFITSDVVEVKRGKSEVEKIKRHSGRSRHKWRFRASQNAWFISANPCLECAAVMHCDNKFGCFTLYLTTFSFVTGYWGCFHLFIMCLLAHSNATAPTTEGSSSACSLKFQFFTCFWTRVAIFNFCLFCNSNVSNGNYTVSGQYEMFLQMEKKKYHCT